MHSIIYLAEVSSIFFQRLFLSKIVRIKDLRAENIIHCTDCKAHKGNMIKIFRIYE